MHNSQVNMSSQQRSEQILIDRLMPSKKIPEVAERETPKNQSANKSFTCRSFGVRNNFNMKLIMSGHKLPIILLVLYLLSLIQSESTMTAAQGKSSAKKSTKVAARLLEASRLNFVRSLDLAKSSSHINSWFMNQVAPVVATKIIDNVLKSPVKSKSQQTKTSKSESGIDTQALADKIVDTLADGIKSKRSKSSPDGKAKDNSNSDIEQNQVIQPKSLGSNRKGKSLVGDSVQHVVQSLLSRDNKKLLGRAMEKSHKYSPFRANSNHFQHQQQVNQNQVNANNSSWHLVKEPAYEHHHFSSTDSSQLDENPVVIRAEHAQNMTTISPLSLSLSNSYEHNQAASSGQNISPLISSLMSSTTTNQMGQKLLQKHRIQQKYVHTNRHQQQQLSPKPWPSSSGGNRRPQQSPYSLPVTSDLNIVQAPSSPAPPATFESLSNVDDNIQEMMSTSTTTSTTTANPLPPFSYPRQSLTMTQLGPNKFKINNKHQHPSAVISSPSSWYSGSRPTGSNPYSNNHRFQHHHPSTTSTTTTTTTTTTTPEPPMQTDPPINETLDPIMDLDQQTSSPVTSILSSVAQSALESLSHSHSNSVDDINSIYQNSYTNTSSTSGSSSLTGTKGGASPSTTTARHSVISAEAIPTALGAPLYHLNRANYTATSIMSPPPRRSGSSPSAKMAAEYFKKSLTNLSTNIFSRQNKSWTKRLGIGSMLLSLIYGAAVLANPGAPLPTSGLEVLQALTKNRRRRGSRGGILPPVGDADRYSESIMEPVNAALLDNANSMNILQQQPHLIPIIEHLIKQEQMQQQMQRTSELTQRKSSSSPLEIESYESSDQIASRRANPSQYITLNAIPGQMTPENMYLYQRLAEPNFGLPHGYGIRS